MKKPSTYREKVDKAINGASWEEARDIGVEILGKYVGFHTHMDGEFDFMTLLKDIATFADNWVTTGQGAQVIAMARLARRIEQQKKQQNEQPS